MHRSPLLKQYKISSPYGWRFHPLTKLPLFHNGVDLTCPIDTPIIAPFAGNCVPNFNRFGGQQLFLYGNGLRLGFAHLKHFIAADNFDAKQGAVIAYSGNSGLSNGPHLHFSVYDLKKKTYVNPVNYFVL